MTQSTLRFLIGATLAVGLAASLARGDDKNKPELLPPPHCEACDKAPGCCSPDAPCCQENAPCCQSSTLTFVPRVSWSDADFLRPWSTENQMKVACPVMCCGAQANSGGVSILQVQVCCESKDGAKASADQAAGKKSIECPMERRVFPVLDLVNPVVPRMVAFGPNGQNWQHPQACFADELIKLIQNTIAPESWSVVGGPGTIEFFPLGKSIVLNQSPDIVEQVQEFLIALRRLEVQTEVNSYTNAPRQICPITNATAGITMAAGLLRSCDSTSPSTACPMLTVAHVAPTLAKVESCTVAPGQYSKMEREILRKLDCEVASFSYAGSDFTKAIQDLARMAGVNIVLDCPALIAAGLEDDPAGMSVPMKMEGARLRSVLTLFLHQGQMTFKVENDAIVVVPDLVLINSLRCQKNQAEAPVIVGSDNNPAIPLAKVGQIVILGDHATSDAEIRRTVGLCPGQTFAAADLKVAQQNLANLKIQGRNVAWRVAPSVCVNDPDKSGEFKDVLVTVQEQPCGESKPAGCVNSNPRGAANQYQASNSPSVILVQPSGVDLGEIAGWAIGAFAEWVCEGTTEKCCPALPPATFVAPPTPPAACPPPGPQQPRVVTTVGPDGLTRMGIEFESCTRFPSPLPPPTPTFHVPTVTPASMTAPQPMPVPPIAQMASPARVQDCPAPVPSIPTAFASQACPVPAAPTVTPTVVQQTCPTTQQVPSTPQFVPFGFVNQFTTTPIETAAVPSCCMQTAYVRGGDPWVMRMKSDSGKQTFTVQSASASIECERLSLKWKEHGSLEFVRGPQCIRVQCKNFEAEAESIDWQEQDGKLVLAGKASIKMHENGKPMSVLNAERIIWNCQSSELQAIGASTLMSR